MKGCEPYLSLLKWQMHPFYIHMLSRYAMMLLPRYIQCIVNQLLREMGDGMIVCIL